MSKAHTPVPGLAQQRQAFRQLFLRCGECRHEAQTMRAWGIDQQPEFAGADDDLRRRVAAKLQRKQKSPPTHFAQTEIGREAAQPVGKLLGHIAHPDKEAAGGQGFEHRQPGCTNQRVTAIGAALVARHKAGACLFRQQRRKRNATADTFAQRHDVRLDPILLVGE